MEAKSHSGADARRVFVAVALATVAAMVTAGFTLGQHSESAPAAHSVAAVAPARAEAPVSAHDPSLPDTAEVIGVPATTTEEPTPTF